ncbi:MAG: hypothetical protein M0Z50_05825 [Planctomycetia bacterium]|nr:hypothetical protein [Planctomycetia bacterium]
MEKEARAIWFVLVRGIRRLISAIRNGSPPLIGRQATDKLKIREREKTNNL